MSARRTRVLVVTYDQIGPRMAGPAIRAFELSRVLAREHDVLLACRHRPERDGDGFDVRFYEDQAALEAMVDWCDVVLAFGFLLVECPAVVEKGKVVIADLYDPFTLEVLVHKGNGPVDELREEYWGSLIALSEQLRKADFFLVASERQRDLVLGMLVAANRVNPDNYLADPTLDNLIRVVPFGLPTEPPVPGPSVLRGVRPGFEPNDLVLLWAGGIYEWFDPISLIEGVAMLDADDVKLLFLGTAHPNPEVPLMPVVSRAMDRAADLGVRDRLVFFNEGWVPYEERVGYLLEADIGVSTHHRHIETAYAFRTRMLDYIWTGLPVLCTEGDTLADLVRARDLGEVVPAEDPRAIADAVVRLGDVDRRARCAANLLELANDLRWDRVAQPIVEVCRRPHHAADRVDGNVPLTPAERHLNDVFDARLAEKERHLQDIHAEVFKLRQERETMLREIDELAAFREQTLDSLPHKVLRKVRGS